MVAEPRTLGTAAVVEREVVRIPLLLGASEWLRSGALVTAGNLTSLVCCGSLIMAVLVTGGVGTAVTTVVGKSDVTAEGDGLVAAAEVTGRGDTRMLEGRSLGERSGCGLLAGGGAMKVEAAEKNIGKV